MKHMYWKGDYDAHAHENGECSKPDCAYCYNIEDIRLGKVTEEGIIRLGLAQKEKSATVADFFLRSS